MTKLFSRNDNFGEIAGENSSMMTGQRPISDLINNDCKIISRVQTRNSILASACITFTFTPLKLPFAILPFSQVNKHQAPIKITCIGNCKLKEISMFVTRAAPRLTVKARAAAIESQKQKRLWSRRHSLRCKRTDGIECIAERERETRACLFVIKWLACAGVAC
jgi:hypothetical protein